MEDYIQRCNFDIYGVGGIITTYRYVKWLCDLIKKYHPYSKVVVGGALATTAWRIIAPYLNCDHFIIGEGEYAIQNIVGLHDKILFQPVIQNLDELPLPDYENLPTLETYLKNPIGGLNVRKWVDGKPTSNVKNVNIITARGCPYHCYFCLPAGTRILTRSLSWKPIEEIGVGEELIGFDEYSPSNRRSFRSATVTERFKRIDMIYLVETDKGVFYATREHPWLTLHGRWRRTSQLRYGHLIKWFAEPLNTPPEDDSYRRGYLKGAFEGDACLRDSFWLVLKKPMGQPPKHKPYQTHFSIRRSRSLRFAVKDEDFLQTASIYVKALGLHMNIKSVDERTSRLRQALVTYRRGDIEAVLKSVEKEPLSSSYIRGWLAGIFDAEGSCDGVVLRVANKSEAILNKIETFLDWLGFSHTRDIPQHGVYAVRLLGGLSAVIRFFALINPKIQRKKDALFRRRRVRAQYAMVQKVTPLWFTTVYNLETTTHTFIAEGLASHNCASHYLGRGYRRRSLDKVLEEIELLKARYDVKYIHFTDELTFTTPSQTLSMARELAKLNILWGAPVRIDLLDEELMKVMSEAGCIHIGMGVESFSKQMLERMNKPMNLNQVKENLKKAQKIIQDVKYTLIIGFPGEDEASLKETLQGVKEVGLKPENVFYATPYPQTWLWEYALREGFIKDEEKFLSNLGEQHELKVNFTGLKDEELKDWRVKILEDG